MLLAGTLQQGSKARDEPGRASRGEGLEHQVREPVILSIGAQPEVDHALDCKDPFTSQEEFVQAVIPTGGS